MAIKVDWSSLGESMETGEPPAASIVVALSPDGSFDLAALGKELEKAVEAGPAAGQLRDLAVGDLRLRVSGDETMNMAVPTMVDGHLVMVMSNDLEKNAERLLASDERYTGGSGNDPLFVHVELNTMMKTLMDVVGAQMEDQGAPFDVVQLMRDAGLGSLDSFTMSLGAEGKHVAASFEMGMKEGDRGIFNMIDTGVKTAPKVLRYVPPASEQFNAMSVNLGALYDVVAKVWGGLGDVVPMTWEDAQTSFAEGMKVRLKEDLIDHLGMEVLMLQDLDAVGAAAAAEDIEDNPAAQFAGMCVGSTPSQEKTPAIVAAGSRARASVVMASTCSLPNSLR
jgi:hypothetical protein